MVPVDIYDTDVDSGKFEGEYFHLTFSKLATLSCMLYI